MSNARGRLVGAGSSRRFARPVAAGAAVAAASVGALVPAQAAGATPVNPVLNAIPSGVVSFCGFSGFSGTTVLFNQAASERAQLKAGTFGVGSKDYPTYALCDALYTVAFNVPVPTNASQTKVVDAATQISSAIENWGGMYGSEYQTFPIPVPYSWNSISSNFQNISRELKTAVTDLTSASSPGWSSTYSEAMADVALTAFEEGAFVDDEFRGVSQFQFLILIDNAMLSSTESSFEQGNFALATADGTSAASLLYTTFWNWW